jgi:two-component system, NarL family, response regulator LiaR
MRLLLADEHTLFRQQLRQLLGTSGFEVVGEARNGASAVRLARELRPDVTVIDVSIPGMYAAEATEAILDENPSARVIVLTVSVAEEKDALDALLAGACGYLRKGADAAELAAGVRAAAAGDAIISPVVATRLVAHMREQRRAERVEAQPKPPPLTARECDILRLLAQGRENSAIAAELVISPATVKTHVAHLLDKLDLENRVQAAVFAVRHGIV